METLGETRRQVASVLAGRYVCAHSQAKKHDSPLQKLLCSNETQSLVNCSSFRFIADFLA